MAFTHRKIKTPKSLGDILKNARKKKEITLEQAEEETKVRARYLEALEENRFDDLPESVYTMGFLAKYAEFLELHKEALIEKFIEERGSPRFGEAGRDHASSRLMVERRLKEPLFQITSRFFVIAGIGLVLAGILGYIGYSVHNLTSPPNLEIASPSSDQILKEDRVEIVGKTDEGVTIMINNQPVFIDERGNFSQEVKLVPGLNSFEVRAINQLKKENIKIVKVLAEF